MAINDIVQTIAEARVDARSLSEFMFKPAGFKVARRLAPQVDTFQFYINRFNSLNGDFSSSVSASLLNLSNSVAEADSRVAYIETTVQDAISQSILASGFVTIDSFEAGATITQRNQALRHTATGKLYRWGGSLPKVVAASSTPDNSGGIAANAWLEVSDTVLRQELTSHATSGLGAMLVKDAVVSLNNVNELAQVSKGNAAFNDNMYIKGHTTPDDGSGGSYLWVDKNLSKEVLADEYSSVYTPPSFDSTGASGAWVKQSGKLRVGLKVLVPSTYPTLRDAIDDLSKFATRPVSVIEIHIESGYKLKEGLKVTRGDFSRFRITSADPVVYSESTFKPNEYVFKFENCNAPSIEILVDMEGRGYTGVHYTSSLGEIRIGAGVKNAGLRGLEVVSSNVTANNTIWDYAKERGVRVSYGSAVSLRNASAQYCGFAGLACVSGNVTISGSNLSNNGTDTASVEERSNITVSGGGNVVGEDVLLNNAGTYGAQVLGFLSLTGKSEAKNCATAGIYCTDGGVVKCKSINTVGSSTGLHVDRGGSIYAPLAIISDTTNPKYTGIKAEGGGRVYAQGSQITGSTMSVWAAGGSYIDVKDSTITQATGDLYTVENRSEIYALGATTGKTNGSLNGYGAKFNGTVWTDLVTNVSDSAIIAKGQSSVVVAHGMAVKPSHGEIFVSPRSGLQNASYFYIDETEITDTTFTLRLDAPLADKGLKFSYRIGR